MKVLILGAKGSLGQTFVDLYKDHEVSAWDREELDIADEEMVTTKITDLKPELIINCAAYNNVDQAEEDRDVANSINGYAVGFISRVADEIGAIFVTYSTGQVFDGNSSSGYNEDDETRPANAYGKSKLLGEMELAEKGDKFYLIRTCWLYGQPAAGKKSFPDIMLDLVEKGGTLNAVQDEFGNPTYVIDLAQATRALIENQQPFGIYHLTNSGVASRYDWAKEIFSIKNQKVDLQPVDGNFFPRKAKRPKFEALNNTKFIELRPWTEALKEYLL